MADRSKRRLGLINVNIGTIIFGACLLYILICVIIFLTTKHINTYQVTEGPLARNQVYSAIAVREEKLVSSNNSGYIYYYAQDGRKVRKTGAVYSLSQNERTTSGVSQLDEADLAKIRSQVAQFATAFDSANFNNVYNFKYALSGSILNYSGLEGQLSTTIGSETIYTATDNGLVIYGQDGFEELSAENISGDSFSQSSYSFKNLKSSGRIEAGDVVYKLITDDNWSIMIQLNEAQAASLEGRSAIRVCFLKDDATMTGILHVIKKDNDFYAQIDFTTGMARYADQRYLEVELVTNSQTGLKIPVSSIVTKAFYLIPVDFALSDVANTTFQKRVTYKDGETSVETVTPTIYAKTDEYYYVDPADFAEHDILEKEDSNQTFRIEEMDELEGVYCINKGYAVFRKIEIIDQNEDYCIVSSGSRYGLALYDNIVLDGTTVKEDEILY